MWQSLIRLAFKKWVIGSLAVVVVGGGLAFYGLKAHGQTEPTRYVLSPVTRGTIVTSISGSGHVSAENQLDVSPGVSGAITRVSAKTGDTVTAGQVLATIDARSQQKTVRQAQQSVRDAQISLESAQIAYDKLVHPDPNSSSLLQAQNAVNQAQRNLDELLAPPDSIDLMNAQDKVRQAEENAKLASDGVTPKTVRDAYDKTVNSLQTLVNTTQKSLDDANDILGIDGNPPNIYIVQLFSVLDQSEKEVAITDYARAKDLVQKAQDAIDPLAPRNEDMKKIDAAIPLLRSALDATNALLKDVKAGLGDTLTSSQLSQSTLDQYSSTIQSDLSSVTAGDGTLSSQEDAIDAARDAYTNAQADLSSVKASLAKLEAGADPDDIAAARETLAERKQSLADLKGSSVEDIDIKVAKNTIEQRQSSLANARDTLIEAQGDLADYTVKAPFDGVIADFKVHASDQASQSTVIATLLTKAKIAEITVNEVDVAKIKNGQKATLTFDAVPELTIAGTVSQVDMIGTTSQGVVTYTVKVAFLTDDDRVRTGMSVSAAVVTDVRTDVLQVPNGAIKTINGMSIVQTLDVPVGQDASSVAGITSDKSPTSISIQTGASNDAVTEITDGLTEGQLIITRTIIPTTATAASSRTTTGLGIPGLGGGATFVGGNATFRAAGGSGGTATLRTGTTGR